MTTRLAVLIALALGLGTAGAAFAVSDGNYSPGRQHCTGAADDSQQPDRVEDGCKNLILTVSDGSGHEYAGLGTRQTADGDDVNTMDGWLDPGQGTRIDGTLGPEGPDGGMSDGTAADPSSGLHVYFGADDNLDEGEHDSSPQVSNGPSDGGAIQANVVPDHDPWLRNVLDDPSYVLMYPAPFVDAGIGACADGICFSVQSQRRVIFQGGNDGTHRDAADYDGKQWDPQSCSGPSDQPSDCGGEPLSSWNAKEGTVYAEPGVQVYEDPDAQASPIGPYPLPAVYAGTCGGIVGGGSAPAAPDSPVTNDAGQIEARTGCE